MRQFEMSQLFDTPQINRGRCGAKQVAVLVVMTVSMLLLGVSLRGQSAPSPAEHSAASEASEVESPAPESPWTVVNKSEHEEAVNKLPPLDEAGEAAPEHNSDSDPDSPKGFLPKKVEKKVVAESYMVFILTGCKKKSLGIDVQNTDGCVTKVTPGSPAYKAGIRVGDCILSVDNKVLESTSKTIVDLVNTALDEHELIVAVQAAQTRADSAADSDSDKQKAVAPGHKKFTLNGCVKNGRHSLGLRVHTPQIGRQNLYITEVTPGGPADIAGLRVDSYIVSVDGKIAGPRETIGSLIDDRLDTHVIVVQEGDSHSNQKMVSYQVIVPPGVFAGKKFLIDLDGEQVEGTVPAGAGPGSKLKLRIPARRSMPNLAATAPSPLLGTQKPAATMTPAALEEQAKKANLLLVPYCDKIQKAEASLGKREEDKKKDIENADKRLVEDLCEIWNWACDPSALDRSLAFKDAKAKVKSWAKVRAETTSKVDKLKASVLLNMAAKKLKASLGGDESRIRRSQEAQQAAYSSFEKLIEWLQIRSATIDSADAAAVPKIAAQ